MNSLYVFILATFLGFEVIRRVSPLLHTPLMSLTNAISAISLIGSLVILGEQSSTLSTILGIDFRKNNQPLGVNRPIPIVDTSKGVKVISELL